MSHYGIRSFIAVLYIPLDMATLHICEVPSATVSSCASRSKRSVGLCAAYPRLPWMSAASWQVFWHISVAKSLSAAISMVVRSPASVIAATWYSILRATLMFVYISAIGKDTP